MPEKADVLDGLTHWQHPEDDGPSILLSTLMIFLLIGFFVGDAFISIFRSIFSPSHNR